MVIENLLETFRVCFPLTRVTVYDDFLVYKTRRGLAKAVAEDANDVIAEKGWPLVAIATNFVSNDTIVIKSNETDL